jgi:glycosyltransferase involved in cell wall biosynthesis
MTEKKKILVLSDHPLSPSGVGTQTKYFIEALLKTNRYKFVCLGGAIKHQKYDPIKVDPWGEDWIIYPVDGYGDHDIIRSLLRTERPDILWFMTDPRFWGWLWQIEDEVRPLVPMVYYHVWDNYPYPNYNAKFYDSTDVVVAISKLTHDVVQNVSPDVESHYLPHSVDTEVFKKLPESQVADFMQKGFASYDNKFTIFWNNRNARRKQSGSVIWWFNDFLNKVGRDNARLVMHTDPKDVNGQDLVAILEELDLVNGQVFISKEKVPPKILAFMYNMADCTINISDAEGFGLATLESLACETPIITTMTGGLQEQVTDGENWFGIGIEPASKSIIGSQSVPYIYEDRISGEDVVDALLKLYNMTNEEREALGSNGRQHVMDNYNFKEFQSKWVDLIDDIIERYGSWETRNKYTRWEMLEVA